MRARGPLTAAGAPRRPRRRAPRPARRAHGAAGASRPSSSGRGCRLGRPGGGLSRVMPRPSASFTLQQTVPTGFSSLPPSGPAMPVIATAVSARSGAAPLGHRVGHGLGDRAVLLDQRGVHAQQLHLRLVGVRHDPARHVRGRPRALGQARRQEPCGARLRSGDPAAREQLQPPGRRCSSRPRRRSRAPWRSRDDLEQLRRRRAARIRLEANDHLDLAPPQAGGDLELPEAVDALLRIAQRVREAGLRHPEDAAPSVAVLRPAGDRLLDAVGRHRGAPHRLELARRSRQHHDRRRRRERPRPAPSPPGR